MSNLVEFVEGMKKRTKGFALQIIFLFRKLPKTPEAQLIGKQLLRSATSVAANYRAVCQARSNNEFYSKLSITIEEINESVFWLELLEVGGIMPAKALTTVRMEADALMKILAKSRRTMKLNKSKKN